MFKNCLTVFEPKRRLKPAMALGRQRNNSLQPLKEIFIWLKGKTANNDTRATQRLQGPKASLSVCLRPFLNIPLIDMQTQEIETFRENVDSWIKQIRREFSEFSDIPNVVNENTDNIQHNYELIYELRDQIEELKQELNALKLIQIISLKQQKSGAIQTSNSETPKREEQPA